MACKDTKSYLWKTILISYILVTYPMLRIAHIYYSNLRSQSLHLLSFNNIHLPALVLPVRLRMLFFCKSARLRSKVRLATAKATAICATVMRESFFINSHIFICISDSCTTAKLPPLPPELPPSLPLFTFGVSSELYWYFFLKTIFTS